ncbi:bestrophin family protein [Skeletonema marinoi]|uniref:Bestrophin family protein n=1 Tax=Skeletonema marinoi TaxID=267567 RepID=A0AAD8XTJ3_9STRA|nr:bestrophin family protein [Skeletonema marinoi]|eukprot:scaffold29032_cov152-Skeletonema_marinoi.AAC.3
MLFRCMTAFAVLAAAAPTCEAFSTNPTPLAIKPSTSTQQRTNKSALFMGPPNDPSAPSTDLYGEGSRKYRRTVYTHDQWVKHRSPDRFVNNLSTLFNSGIYKNVGKEVFATTSVAIFVWAWNMLVGGYQDLAGVAHDPIIQEEWAKIVGLPLQAFTTVSPSLGLLLAFRTNSSYKRWDEARKFWGLNINHTRDLNRMATAWYGHEGDPWDGTEFMGAPSSKSQAIDPAERQYHLGQISLMTWAFVRSMKRHLSPPAEDEEDYIAEMKSRLSPEQAEAIISAVHRPNRALYDLSVAIEKLPMHFLRKDELNKNLSIFEDTLGGCERLLSSPIPLFYSRHTARFLSTWLLLLPFALYGQFGDSWNHIMMIPATAFISISLFGIEELATQLEEPFTILPMQGFCDKIGGWCDEITSWAGQGQEAEEAIPSNIADIAPSR